MVIVCGPRGRRGGRRKSNFITADRRATLPACRQRVHQCVAIRRRVARYSRRHPAISAHTAANSRSIEDLRRRRRPQLSEDEDQPGTQSGVYERRLPGAAPRLTVGWTTTGGEWADMQVMRAPFPTRVEHGARKIVGK